MVMGVGIQFGHVLTPLISRVSIAFLLLSHPRQTTTHRHIKNVWQKEP
jgi:hypothetical protein